MFYWIVWLVVSIAFITYYSAVILPLLFSRLCGAAFAPADRGIGKFNLKNGIAILYEPDLLSARYFKRYALYQRADESFFTFFIGEWTEQFGSAEYEIIAYNKYGRAIADKRVWSCPHGGRFSDPVLLPAETESVSLTVLRADGQKLRVQKKRGRHFYLYLILFALGAALDLAALLFVGTTFFSRAMGGFQADGIFLSAAAWVRLLLPPCLIVLFSVMLVGLVKIHASKLSELFRAFHHKTGCFFFPCKRICFKAAGLLKQVKFFLLKGRYALRNLCFVIVQFPLFFNIKRFFLHIRFRLRRLFRRFGRKKKAQNG